MLGFLLARAGVLSSAVLLVVLTFGLKYLLYLLCLSSSSSLSLLLLLCMLIDDAGLHRQSLESLSLEPV